MTVIFVVALMLASAAAQAQLQPFHCAYSSPRLERPEPVLLGWPDLAHSGLAPGVSRELRVHQQLALFAPDYSMRILNEGRRVTGEVLVYWPGMEFKRVTGGDSGCAEWNEHEAKTLIRVVRQSLDKDLDCGPVERRPRIEGCRVIFVADPGWAEMLRRSDSLGVWTIDSAVPSNLGFDGESVLIEVRDRAGYRRYDYHDPVAEGGSGERQAAALRDLLQEALEKAHREHVGR
jgi:hypothetical protein